MAHLCCRENETLEAKIGLILLELLKFQNVEGFRLCAQYVHPHCNTKLALKPITKIYRTYSIDKFKVIRQEVCFSLKIN